jgi:hypothetical protein
MCVPEEDERTQRARGAVSGGGGRGGGWPAAPLYVLLYAVRLKPWLRASRRDHGTTPARGPWRAAIGIDPGRAPPSTPLSGATLPTHPGAPPARPRGERRHVSATPRHVAPSSPLLCASSRGAWPRPCPVPRSVSLPCGGSGAGTTRAPSQAAPLLRWPHGTPLTVVLLPPRSPSLSAQEPLLS